MGRCKEIEIKVIPASIANPFVRAHHYSGKVVPNSVLHFGCFLDGCLHGVLSYGGSTDRRKVMTLVTGTGWNEFLELNRMAFDDYLPRNSESYCIGATLRMIKKQASHIKWVISFADGTACGDGTIYRASNFVLTGIKPNKTILEMPDGSRVAGLVLDAMLLNKDKIRYYETLCGLDHDHPHTRNDYVRGGGEIRGGLSTAIYIFYRQILSQTFGSSRVAILRNRCGGGRNVQRAKPNVGKPTSTKKRGSNGAGEIEERKPKSK